MLSSTLPAHRISQTLLMFFAFMDAGPKAAHAHNVSDDTHSAYICTQRRGEAFSITMPAQRMCEMLFTFFKFWDGGLHPDKGQVLSRNVPAHRMYDTSFIVFASLAAGLLPDALPRSSVLKYHACAQNVSDVIRSSHILAGWPTPR